MKSGNPEMGVIRLPRVWVERVLFALLGAKATWLVDVLYGVGLFTQA